MPPHIIELGRAGLGNFAVARGRFVQILWFVVEACIINNRLLPISRVREVLLRLFGAKIGTGCRFLHAIRVKYPWKFEVGNNSWFGEGVWIYNQAPIIVGSNVCISQNTFLTSGSHNTFTNMDLNVKPIVIEDGVWITSGCVVQMGVTIGASVVVTPLSVVHKSLPANGIYGGNPCKFIKQRFE